MYVNTTEAARRLKISTSRLRQLLREKRVKGAYKNGKYWLIPTYKGLPAIEEGKRGLAGTWKKVRKLQKITANINTHKIRDNIQKSKCDREPPILLKQKKPKEKVYLYELEIPTPCRIIYDPDNPLECGARLWIEVLDCELTELIACQP